MPATLGEGPSGSTNMYWTPTMYQTGLYARHSSENDRSGRWFHPGDRLKTDWKSPSTKMYNTDLLCKFGVLGKKWHGSMAIHFFQQDGSKYKKYNRIIYSWAR